MYTLTYTSAPDLAELMDQLASRKRHTYCKGDYVFLGEPTHHLYLVCNGQVKIGAHLPNGRAIIKDILIEGNLFGEVSTAPTYNYNSFAQVVTDRTEVMAFLPEELPGLPEKVQAYLFQMMHRRVRRLESQLESISGRTVPYRVIDLLCRLGREQGKKVGLETMVRHSITHADIAMLIGTSRQTVSGILAKLRQDNFINYDRHRILIRDLARLETVNAQERFAM